MEKQSQYVEKMRSYIEGHYNEMLSLQEVAEYLDLTPPYVSTIFKKEVGIGFSDYLNEVRMHQAKKLIDNEDRPLKDISAEVGYQYYPYFSNTFKQKYKMTPREYAGNRNR